MLSITADLGVKSVTMVRCARCGREGFVGVGAVQDGSLGHLVN